jgi:small subunit ribosomal protein S16
MVVIRLSRNGKKHDSRYRITVADSRRYVTSKYLDILGTYIPTPRGQEKKVVLDLEKYNSWVQKGAQPSDRVKHVVKLAQQAK